MGHPRIGESVTRIRIPSTMDEKTLRQFHVRIRSFLSQPHQVQERTVSTGLWNSTTPGVTIDFACVILSAVHNNVRFQPEGREKTMLTGKPNR